MTTVFAKRSLCTALASYVTSTTLAGSDPLAGKFGFNTSTSGTGAKSTM
jgi:hypothetical protein